jgi:hypothetical protein
MTCVVFAQSGKMATWNGILLWRFRYNYTKRDLYLLDNGRVAGVCMELLTSGVLKRMDLLISPSYATTAPVSYFTEPRCRLAMERICVWQWFSRVQWVKSSIGRALDRHLSMNKGWCLPSLSPLHMLCIKPGSLIDVDASYRNERTGSVSFYVQVQCSSHCTLRWDYRSGCYWLVTLVCSHGLPAGSVSRLFRIGQWELTSGIDVKYTLGYTIIPGYGAIPVPNEMWDEHYRSFNMPLSLMLNRKWPFWSPSSDIHWRNPVGFCMSVSLSAEEGLYWYGVCLDDRSVSW